jgi:hypothetical protein
MRVVIASDAVAIGECSLLMAASIRRAWLQDRSTARSMSCRRPERRLDRCPKSARDIPASERRFGRVMTPRYLDFP